MYYELAPAYGRDYKNRKEVTDAFLAGQDFEGDYQLGFQYVNRPNFKSGDCVNLRYARLQKVAVVKIP